MLKGFGQSYILCFCDFSGCGSLEVGTSCINWTLLESFCNSVQVHQNIVQVLKLTVVSKTDLRLQFTDSGVAWLLQYFLVQFSSSDGVG